MPSALPASLVLLLLLQGTFTDDAVIITMGVYCGDFEGGDHRRSFLSVVYAFSKTALYTRPPEDGCNIYAATYFPATSWYRSVPPSGQALVESKYKPFNNYVQPARPQDVEDVDKPPMLVMKVGGQRAPCRVLERVRLAAALSHPGRRQEGYSHNLARCGCRHAAHRLKTE